jgi:hypothetical protein
MDVPSYQQLLAEQYEENARNLLVFQHEYENDDVDDHEDHDYTNKEVPDPELFNRVQERHDLANVIQPKKEFEDKSKLSVRYNKDIRTHVFNIDSRFRNAVIMTDPSTNSFDSQSTTNFLFRLSRTIKNIASVKLSSFEFPNIFYTFSTSRNNSSFIINLLGNVQTITIDTGNYLQSGSDVLIDYTAVCNEIEGKLDAAYGLGAFTVTYNTSTDKVTITNAGATNFTITFTNTASISNLGLTATNRNNGIGYFLGFQNYTYTGAPSYTGESGTQIVGDQYIYLSLSDWDNVQHQDYNQTHFSAFAKILLGGKNKMTIDTLVTNTTTKEYHFTQPTNIGLIAIQVLDAFGNIIDLRDVNISMTLELHEIINMALYEKMRDL